MTIYILGCVVLFLVGCHIGYLICITSWIKELSNELNQLDIEMTKIKSKMEVENVEDKI